MFQKVLIAEDQDTTNAAIIQLLEELNVPQIHTTKYCDEALLKIKVANQEEEPFELLISDLSFKKDHQINQINSGLELIAAVKKIQPNIKVITYSIEDKSFQIKELFEKLKINGYIIKGRNSHAQLKTAIQIIDKNPLQKISPLIPNSNSYDQLIQIEQYDIQLLKTLALGYTVLQIVQKFKDSNIIPYGESSVEKKLAKLKLYFKANNNIHLIAIVKDLGII